MKKVKTSNCRFTILEGFLPDSLRVEVQSLMNQWKNNQLELHSIRGLFDYTHTVDHGHNHVLRVLRIASQILLPYLLKSPKFLNEYEIFCLISAIWLHDIGHGYVPDEEGSHFWEVVREHHGLYSEKRILGDERNLILPGVDDKLVSSIGQICCYHQKRKPLTESQQEALGTYMTPIKEKINYEGKDIRLKFLAALLQLADACDISYRRVISEARAEKEQRMINSECEELRHILAILKDSMILKAKEIKELEGEARLRALEQIERTEQSIKRFTVKLEALENQIPKHHFKHLAIETVYPIRAEREAINIMIIPSLLGRIEKTKKGVGKSMHYAIEDIQKEFALVESTLIKNGIGLGDTYIFKSFEPLKKVGEKALNEIRRNVESDSASIPNKDKIKIKKLIELVSNRKFEPAFSKSKGLIEAVEKKHQKREPTLSALRCITGLALSYLAYWEEASIEYNKVSVNRRNWRELAEKRISSLDKDTDKDGWPDEFELLYGTDIHDYTRHPAKFNIRLCPKVV